MYNKQIIVSNSTPNILIDSNMITNFNLNSGEVKLLKYIIENEKDGWTEVKFEELAKMLECSELTVKRLLKTLLDNEIINQEKNRSLKWTINKDIICENTHHKNKSMSFDELRRVFIEQSDSWVKIRTNGIPKMQFSIRMLNVIETKDDRDEIIIIDKKEGYEKNEMTISKKVIARIEKSLYFDNDIIIYLNDNSIIQITFEYVKFTNIEQ
jgi:DNA-binding Lrp family transcriptional regulator